MSLAYAPSTSRQLQDDVYAFVVAYLQANNGIPPTIREIGNAVGISSTSHVDYALEGLEKRGLISRKPHVSRSIRLQDKQVVMAELVSTGERSLHLKVIRDGKAYRGRIYLEAEHE